MENAPLVGSGASASLLLGRKLDSIPFSIYHVQIILVLGVVGFVEGYDLALGGSLLVLAKEPLHLTPEQRPRSHRRLPCQTEIVYSQTSCSGARRAEVFAE